MPPTQHELVELGVCAPSPDNNQPWLFSLQPEGIRVFLDSRRSLPSDVGGMFDLQAIGAVIENIVLAARHGGLAPEVCLNGALDADWSRSNAPQPGPLEHREIALVRLPAPAAGPSSDVSAGSVSPAAEVELYAAIPKRCTNRCAFSRSSLASGELESLSCASACDPDVRLDWITGRPSIGKLSAIVARGDRLRLEHQPFHEELYKQLRLSADQVEQTRDGLDWRTLGLPPGGRSLLATLARWPLVRTLNHAGLSRALSVPSAMAVRQSAAVGGLSVPAATARNYVTAGRALQRVWLAATTLGLSFHPLGSVPIFLRHADAASSLGGKSDLPRGDRETAGTSDATLGPRQRAAVSDLERRFHELMPGLAGRVVTMLFRVGRAAPVRHRSLRRSAADVIIDRP